jgi:dienelactone hydrolase
MVLLHACSGITDRTLAWGSWFKTEGYVALAVDSFRPRGTRNVCSSPLNPSISDVLQDAFGALAYLRSLPFVNSDRIGVIGWSYGATVALLANVSNYPGKKFQAAVAFYPHCGSMPDDTTTPLLLLLGEADNWTPSWGCANAAKRLQQMGRPVHFALYPGVHHNFDNPVALGSAYGRTVLYDPAATADSEKRVRSFLAQYLRTKKP